MIRQTVLLSGILFLLPFVHAQDDIKSVEQTFANTMSAVLEGDIDKLRGLFFMPDTPDAEQASTFNTWAEKFINGHKDGKTVTTLKDTNVKDSTAFLLVEARTKKAVQNLPWLMTKRDGSWKTVVQPSGGSEALVDVLGISVADWQSFTNWGQQRLASLNEAAFDSAKAKAIERERSLIARAMEFRKARPAESPSTPKAVCEHVIKELTEGDGEEALSWFSIGEPNSKAERTALGVIANGVRITQGELIFTAHTELIEGNAAAVFVEVENKGGIQWLGARSFVPWYMMQKEGEWHIMADGWNAETSQSEYGFSDEDVAAYKAIFERASTEELVLLGKHFDALKVEADAALAERNQTDIASTPSSALKAFFEACSVPESAGQLLSWLGRPEKSTAKINTETLLDFVRGIPSNDPEYPLEILEEKIEGNAAAVLVKIGDNEPVENLQPRFYGYFPLVKKDGKYLLITDRNLEFANLAALGVNESDRNHFVQLMKWAQDRNRSKLAAKIDTITAEAIGLQKQRAAANTLLITPQTAFKALTESIQSGKAPAVLSHFARSTETDPRSRNEFLQVAWRRGKQNLETKYLETRKEGRVSSVLFEVGTPKGNTYQTAMLLEQDGEWRFLMPNSTDSDPKALYMLNDKDMENLGILFKWSEAILGGGN